MESFAQIHMTMTLHSGPWSRFKRLLAYSSHAGSLEHNSSSSEATISPAVPIGASETSISGLVLGSTGGVAGTMLVVTPSASVRRSDLPPGSSAMAHVGGIPSLPYATEFESQMG